MRKLADSQIAAFDTEYVDANRWKMVAACITKYFPEGDFSFVDLGGGNGLFTDWILREFPWSRGVLIDNSEYLIGLNRPVPRKVLICDSIENTARYVGSADIIFCNWLLHHLVSDTYGATRMNITNALRMAKSLLSERGYFSIFENMYDGLYFDNLPSRLIFGLTANRTMAPVLRRLGANTAGCGVCFLSREKWDETVKQAGLTIESYTDDDPWPIAFYRRALLHLGNIRVGHYWCGKGVRDLKASK